MKSQEYGSLRIIFSLLICCSRAHSSTERAWLFLKKFLEELELAYDESVVAKHGDAYRKGYALSLINAAEKKSVFASAFGGADLHPRIERILSYRKISVFSAVCFIAFAVSVAYLLLTNAA